MTNRLGQRLFELWDYLPSTFFRPLALIVKKSRLKDAFVFQ